MSRLEFVASIVRSLAWPGALLLVALLFRAAIRNALTGDIKRWRAGPTGVEVEYWEQTVVEARRQLPPEAEQHAVSAEEGSLSDELAQLANAAPHIAVEEASTRVAQELRRLNHGVEPADKLSQLGLVQLAITAHRHGRITAKSLNAVRGLSVLRTLGVHAADSDRALEFVHLADAILYALTNKPRGGVQG